MCTVSWMHQANGYPLFCNRDEKKTRPVAVPPKVHSRIAAQFLAPVDPQSGGSWIGVNQFGLSICLLNAQPSRNCLLNSQAPAKSRGLLPLQLLSAPSVYECILKLQQLVLTPFDPFMMLVLQPQTPAVVASWDGGQLTIDRSADPLSPLVSSSFEPHSVAKARKAAFARRVRQAGHVSAQVLHDFHSSRSEQHNAFSSCMHREDAETVSFSRVIVSRERIQLLYSPGPPCQCAAVQKVVLDRVRRGRP